MQLDRLFAAVWSARNAVHASDNRDTSIAQRRRLGRTKDSSDDNRESDRNSTPVVDECNDRRPEIHMTSGSRRLPRTRSTAAATGLTSTCSPRPQPAPAPASTAQSLIPSTRRGNSTPRSALLEGGCGLCPSPTSSGTARFSIEHSFSASDRCGSDAGPVGDGYLRRLHWLLLTHFSRHLVRETVDATVHLLRTRHLTPRSLRPSPTTTKEETDDPASCNRPEPGPTRRASRPSQRSAASRISWPKQRQPGSNSSTRSLRRNSTRSWLHSVHPWSRLSARSEPPAHGSTKERSGPASAADSRSLSNGSSSGPGPPHASPARAGDNALTASSTTRNTEPRRTRAVRLCGRRPRRGVVQSGRRVGCGS